MMTMELKRDMYGIMSSKRGYDITCGAEDLSMPKTKPKKLKEGMSHNGNGMVVHHGLSGYGTLGSNRSKYGVPVSDIIFTEIMNIEEPLANLREILEQRLELDLSTYQIWLQDKVKMQPNISLSDQCIKSDGLAQVKVEVKKLNGVNRINIIDVLKLSGDDCDDDDEDMQEKDVDDEIVEDLSLKSIEDAEDLQEMSMSPLSNNNSEAAHWTISDASSLLCSTVPADVANWSEVQIQRWLSWALERFHIKLFDQSLWNINAKQLCQMTSKEFQKKVPADPHNLFWTHIELLRKCRIFAVADLPESNGDISPPNVQTPRGPPVRKKRTSSSSSLSGSMKRPSLGHNGQIQLWQFLLELLGDRSKKFVIQWVGRNGEFKLNDPELVAQMWGERKNKPKMNYEKLSRALRYYYSEAMIAKVHGRRFVYKFVCNLKELIGYSTEELISMVEDDPSCLGEC